MSRARSQIERFRRRRRSRGAELAVLGLTALALLRLGRAQVPYTLRGKTVLVTGGSRGLGLVLAREAAAQGARVAICGRDEDALARAREALERIGAEVMTVPCDVTDRESVRRMIAAVRNRFGPVDMLINNAGVIEVGPAEAMSLADYQEAMNTNFWGMVYPTLEVVPEMRQRRSGRIVNITSIGAKLGVPHLVPYSASKFAAIGFSQALRAELAAEGIKVVAVVPGLMRTGSPRNAIFRGRHKSEYAWFSISDSLPGLSISAEAAARKILEGAKRGDAEVLFQLTAKLAAVANTLAPDLTASVLALAGRLLPHGTEGSGRRPGRESQSWLSPSWLTRLGDRAARRYNQIAPAEGDGR